MWRSIVMWVGGTHHNQAPMSEWSKEPDLRDSTRIIKYLVCRGFESRSVQTSCIWVKYTTFSYSVVVITRDFETYFHICIILETLVRFRIGEFISIHAIIIWII